ncbi:unnamed protein product [Prorocentrum cordatum]|uniref:Transmembrane protein n=1 Tax=Prorocentrum cordatum TaxID=2364126 RepID=A0ABN9RWX4_9DINO|nr:unnamed protein product [Polarella glacialis]
MSEAADRLRCGGLWSSGGRVALAIAAALSFSLIGHAEGKGFSTKRTGKYKKWKPSSHSTPYKKGARAPPSGGRPQKTEEEASTGGEQEGGSKKRSSRNKRRRQMTDKTFPLRAGLVLLADLVGLCGGGCAWYGHFRRPGDCVVCSRKAQQSVAREGFLDAALRFPAPHGFDSFFAVKQLLLLILKVLIYTLGLRDINNTPLIYSHFSLIVFHIILIPLLYLAAQSEVDMQVRTKTPMNSAKSQKQTLVEAGIEVCDVDIMVRMWFILCSREQRHAFFFSCSRTAHLAALGTLHYLPVALQDALAGLSPWAQRALREGKGRRV